MRAAMDLRRSNSTVGRRAPYYAPHQAARPQAARHQLPPQPQPQPRRRRMPAAAMDEFSDPIERFKAMALAPAADPLEVAGSAGGTAGAHPLRGKVGGNWADDGRRAYPSGLRMADEGLPDPRELLKEQLFGGYSPACDDHANKSTPCPDAPYGVSDQYVLLDSPYKVHAGAGGSRPAEGRYCFQVAAQGFTQPGSVGLHDTLTNVISIEVEPFFIPGPQVLPVGPDPVPLPLLTPSQQTAADQAFLYGRVRMNLLGVGEQAVRLGGNGRSNIEFTASLLVLASGHSRYLLEPVLRQAYIFTQPLTSLNSLDFQLRGQNNRPLPLVPDTYYNVLVAPGVPVVFTAPAHGLASGDFVHFLEWASDSGALNRALSDDRHARVVPLTVDSFSLESQDSAGAFLPVADAGPFTVSGPRTLVVPWRRIQVSLRIRTVRDRTTNYKSA